MPYKAKGKCVYKADSGKKVGCTKGPVKDYLAALHANVPDTTNEALDPIDDVSPAYREGFEDGYAHSSELSPSDSLILAGWNRSTTKQYEHNRLREGTCRVCGGDGWYIEPDSKGEPQQVQCSACGGQDGEDDPEPRCRPSGEPENEPFNEIEAVSYNGGLPNKESCKMCGKTPCRCMNLTEIIKKMV